MKRIHLDEVPHKKVITPNKYFRGEDDIYYISRYPEGDAHIHVSYPRDKDGYGGRTFNILMEDGSIDSVRGPYCLDGLFDHGASKMLADLLKDPTLLDKVYRITVGININSWFKSGSKEIIYQEDGFILGDPDKRLKPEWEGLEVSVEGRGFIAYLHVKNGKIK